MRPQLARSELKPGRPGLARPPPLRESETTSMLFLFLALEG